MKHNCEKYFSISPFNVKQHTARVQISTRGLFVTQQRSTPTENDVKNCAQRDDTRRQTTNGLVPGAIATVRFCLSVCHHNHHYCHNVVTNGRLRCATNTTSSSSSWPPSLMSSSSTHSHSIIDARPRHTVVAVLRHIKYIVPGQAHTTCLQIFNSSGRATLLLPSNKCRTLAKPSSVSEHQADTKRALQTAHDDVRSVMESVMSTTDRPKVALRTPALWLLQACSWKVFNYIQQCAIKRLFVLFVETPMTVAGHGRLLSLLCARGS